MKEISIIIPVYNVKEYIEEALDSVINQSFKDFEVILIDDESTDGSFEILKKYEEKDKRIKVIKQKNGGPGKARNTGIQNAIGKYVIFMDSDDVLPKDSLKIRYETIERKNADIVIGGTFAYDGEKKWPIKSHFSKEGFKSIEKDEDLILSLGPCNKIYKTEIVKDIEFPIDIKYGEDQVFVINTYMRAKKIYKINNGIYYYRKRQGTNVSLTDLEKAKPIYVLQQISKAVEKIFMTIKENEKDEYIGEKVKSLYFKRLLNINVWPPIMNLLEGEPKEEKVIGLKIFRKILSIIDKSVIENSEELKIILTYGFMRKIKFLEEKEKEIYREILLQVYGKSKKNLLNKKSNEVYISKDINKIYLIAIANGIKYNFKKVLSAPKKIYKHIRFN